MSQATRLMAVVGVLLSALPYSSAGLGQAVKGAETLPPAVPLPPLHATVNGKQITQADFHATYVAYLRQKFYHGQVPRDQLAQARKEVSDKAIELILLNEEIERRGIQPDNEDVEKQVKAYDQRYGTNPDWQNRRETMLPAMRQQLNERSRLTRLEQVVRDVPPSMPDEVKAFYVAKPELFTEPDKLRMHVILLAVEPSSTRPVWDAALNEAEAIVRRLRNGADFAEQARLSSKDASAEKGGDMGYLHVGMLPESLQAKIDTLKLGEVADPVEMLQGIGIFRLDERIAAKLQDYERVADRAKELLDRERKDRAWKDFVAKLKSAARIVIFEEPVESAAASN